MSKRYFYPLLLPVLASAATFSTPVTGYVAESGPALRAVLGVPGALKFSDPLSLPDGTTKIRLPPAADYAWLERGAASPAVLLLKSGSADAVLVVDAALGSADWAAFSPRGTSAVLYSASAGRLQIIGGLPTAPKVSRDLDASTLPGQPLTAAVTDDGSTLVISTGDAIYVVGPGGPATSVLSGQKIQAVAALPNSSDVVAADSADGTIYLLQNLSSAPVARILASQVAGADYLSTTSDGAIVLAAQPGASSLSMIDVATGAVQSFLLYEAPNGLVPLSNRDVFLTSSRAGDAAWIFYRAGTSGHPLFIPAAQAAEGQE
jgi:hypothetical protein